MEQQRYTYLGTAVKYPIEIDKATGGLVVASGLSVIEGSIINILTTQVGTRYMQPEYGVDDTNLLFEPNDEVLMRTIRFEYLQALRKWEGRAKFYDIETKLYLSYLLCFIRYSVRPYKDVQTFVYPFYRNLKV